MGGQIVRASSSVVLNIAEASGKRNDKELSRYLDIALALLKETVAGVDLLVDGGFATIEQRDTVIQRAGEIAKQLGGFKKLS